jgi:hypothetical protein
VFAIPGVGEGLAMGLGAKGVGEGLGELSTARTPKEAGVAVGKTGLAAGMLIPGAIKSARDIGLTKSAEALEKVTSEEPKKGGEGTSVSGDQFKFESPDAQVGQEFTDNGVKYRVSAVTEVNRNGKKTRTASATPIDPIPEVEPEPAAEPVETSPIIEEAPPTTAAESRANAETKTPEQIQTELDSVRAEIEALPKPAADATPEQRMAYLAKKTEFSNKAGFLKEGLDVQKEAAVPASESINTGALQEMGMGAAKPGEPMGSPMSDLNEVLKNLPDAGKPEVSKAFDLGESVTKAKDTLDSTLEGLKAAGAYLKKRFEGKPEVTNWKRMLGERHLALTESAAITRRTVKSAEKKLPNKLTREAISNWVDTGGNLEKLKQAEAETKPAYRKGYERAQKLTPDELHAAQNIKNYFDTRLDQAIDAGILEGGIENYIHRTYEADSPWKQGVLAELRSGIFTGKPALAKQRVFEYDFEAETAGKRPVKDFAKRVSAYDLALNKAIADRQAIKQMMAMKMPDGRPMIDVGGGGKVIENAAGETDATLINRSRKVNSEDPVENRGDYKSYDHPALRKWKWVASDAEGKPIFLQGDVLVHPDAMKQVGVLFDRSRIRQNPIGRAALGVSSTIKQTMLDLSLFHQTQIGVHAAEHRTWGPIKEIDFKNPDVRGLIRGGAVVGETSGRELFSEGLSGSSLTKHIPWVGERIQNYQDYLFGDFIPRIKVAMGLHALERNAKKFPDLSKEQLYQMTADQMNAAFGELNYEMLGRSKTTQDVLRLTLLAPDFLEARTRFVGQAGTKYGAEQRNALILGAVSMYFFARIANKILDDEWHLEPKNAFNIVHNGKSYGLRTVQGDLIHLATEPGQFVNHRLNPVFAKPALEFATGRDYFGRKRSASDKLKDLALTPVPISLRGIYSGQEQSLLESFFNSAGIVTKRDSPSSDMANLADEWKKANKVSPEPGEFIYDADKDPYRSIRLAAERGDIAAMRSEVEKAKAAGLTTEKIRQHFRLSSAHNFAGSAANEKKFVESLTADQKKIYRDAREERKRIRENVIKAF